MAIIDTYFKEMEAKGASDLHMVVGFPPLVRLRGALVPLEQPVLTPESNLKILFEILSPEQQTFLERNRPSLIVDGAIFYKRIKVPVQEPLATFFFN